MMTTMVRAPVTVVTRAAGCADGLGDDDYREIYDELRQAHSLRQFVERVGSQYSIGWWSKFERGEAALTRAARNELRVAVGLAALPLTVGQALAETDENAVVYRVGDGRVDRVVMVGLPGTLNLHVNGECDASVLDRLVTTVTRRSRRHVVSVRDEVWQRLNEARTADGLTWEQLLLRAVE